VESAAIDLLHRGQATDAFAECGGAAAAGAAFFGADRIFTYRRTKKKVMSDARTKVSRVSMKVYR